MHRESPDAIFRFHMVEEGADDFLVYLFGSSVLQRARKYYAGEVIAFILEIYDCQGLTKIQRGQTMRNGPSSIQQYLLQPQPSLGEIYEEYEKFFQIQSMT